MLAMYELLQDLQKHFHPELADRHLTSIEALGVDIAAFSAMPNESEVMALEMSQLVALNFLQLAIG